MPAKKTDAAKKTDIAKIAVIRKKIEVMEKEMAAIVKAVAKSKAKRV